MLYRLATLAAVLIFMSYVQTSALLQKEAEVLPVDGFGTKGGDFDPNHRPFIDPEAAKVDPKSIDSNFVSKARAQSGKKSVSNPII